MVGALRRHEHSTKNKGQEWLWERPFQANEYGKTLERLWKVLKVWKILGITGTSNLWQLTKDWEKLLAIEMKKINVNSF